jgi:hypothetical protein
MTNTPENLIEVFQTPRKDIEQIRIKIVGGNIRINAHKTDDIKIWAKGDIATLGAKASVQGKELLVTSSSALRYFAQKSRIDLIFEVPEDMAVSMNFFGADVVINGGTGPLSVKGFAGAIEGTTYSKDVSIRFTVGSDDLVRK